MRLRRSSASTLLALLVGVMCVHTIDKVGFSMVLDGIKHALLLTDTEIGFLAGPAFALLNAAAALPLARLADRTGRIKVLAACVLVWSGLTSLMGVASGFATLAALRAGVGCADGAARPVAQALVAAAYPQPRRAGKLATLVSGSYLGTVLGLSAGGMVSEHLGWRSALVVLGLPGLILAVLLWCTAEEPAEGATQAHTAPGAGLKDVLPIIRQPAFVDAAIVVASGNLVGWAAMAWLPSFFRRSYGMGPQETGFWLATAMGLAAAAGALGGGALADRLHARSPRAGLWLGFWTTLASAPLLTAAFVTHEKNLSLACIIVSGLLGSVCIGPIYATVQDLTGRHSRAMIAAVFGAINAVFGQAAGPMLVGMISDISAYAYGQESLRLSLELVSLVGLWPAFHLLRLAAGHRQPRPPTTVREVSTNGRERRKQGLLF